MLHNTETDTIGEYGKSNDMYRSQCFLFCCYLIDEDDNVRKR